MRYHTQLRRLRQIAPMTGEVRGLFISETQRQRMEVFRGKAKPVPEELPALLLLFG